MHIAHLLLALGWAASNPVAAGRHLPARHKRAFSSPTAIAKRQDVTVKQLQQALDDFLNPPPNSTASIVIGVKPSPSQSQARADEGTSESVSREATRPTSTRPSVIGGNPTSSKASAPAGAPPPASSSKAPSPPPQTTPTQPPSSRPTPTADPSTEDIVSISLGGGGVTSKLPSSQPVRPPETTEREVSRSAPVQPTRSADPPAPPSKSDAPSSIVVGPSTDTQEPASSARPRPSDTLTTETDPTTRPDPTTSTTEQETSTEKSVEVGTGESTVDSATRTADELSTTQRDDPTSTSEEEPTRTPEPSRDTQKDESTTRTRSSSEEDTLSISIDLPTLVTDTEFETETSTRERPTDTTTEPVSSTHHAISSIGLPSIVPNATDASPSRTRSRPTLTPVSSSERNNESDFTEITDPETVTFSDPPRSTSSSSSSGSSARSDRSERPSASARPTSSAEQNGSSIQTGTRGQQNSTDAALQPPPSGAGPSGSAASQVTGQPTGQSSSSSEATVTSSSATTTRTPNSYYNFVPTSTLMVNTDAPTESTAPPSSATGPVLTGAAAADETISSVTLPAALPSSLPAKIVPGDAPAQTPSDSTLVSLMFAGRTMGWRWVASSPDTAGQVFAYMPSLLAAALNISEAEVQNTALVAYQTLTDTDASQLMTIYLAALPTDQVPNLQAQVKTPSSQLYTQTDPILQQLSQQLIATFPVNAFTSTEQATIGQAPASAEEGQQAGKKGSNTTVVAVVSSFGSVVALLLAFIGVRYLRRRAGAGDDGPALRALQLGRSDSPLAGGGASPAMSQRSPAHRHVFSSLFTSHHFASARSPRHSGGSSASSAGSSSDQSHGHNNREVQRGISWYSGRYTDFGEDEGGRARSVYGQAITQDAPGNPFADRHASAVADADDGSWLSARSEGVRRLKTGQVQISRPQLEGNSLML